MTWMTWPVVGLVLGLVAMFVFRQTVTRLLDRTRRIGKKGLEAGDHPKELSQPVGASASEELRRQFDNALLVQREDMVRAELGKLGFRDSTERETFLVRVLAAASIVQSFEQIYGSIWGSQLAALQFLNSADLTGVDPGQIRPWYDQAVTWHPADAWVGTYLRDPSNGAGHRRDTTNAVGPSRLWPDDGPGSCGSGRSLQLKASIRRLPA